MQRRTTACRRLVARRALLPLAARAAAPAASTRAGATCSTRRRATSPLARARAAQRPGARRRAHRRGRPARPRAATPTTPASSWQQADGAGQLRPGGGALPDADARLGGRATTAWCCTAPTAARTWTRQLDGRSAGAARWSTYYAQAAKRRRRATRRCSPRRSASRRRAPRTRSSTSGSTTSATGYVVGAFGLMLRTARRRQDLGAAGCIATDNPKALHLYAVRRVGGDAVHRRRAGPAAQARPRQRPLRARSSCRTRARCSASSATRRRRGRLRPARQRVAQHRRRRRPGSRSTPACRSASPAARSTRDGRIVLVSQAGHVLVSADDGASFAPRQARAPAAGGRGRRRRRRTRSSLAGPRGVHARSR